MGLSLPAGPIPRERHARSDPEPARPAVLTLAQATTALQRSLGSEDIAWNSFTSPAGAASAGASPLALGKVPFAQVYGQITGEARPGTLDQPIIGANVFVVGPGQDGVDTDTIVSSGFTGTAVFHVDPEASTLVFVDSVDGKFVVPVPHGQFKVGIEPLTDIRTSAPSSI